MRNKLDIDLDAIDLRLLSAFEAVMIECSISRAARRLGVTQSALSQSIAKLRAILDDELFQRTGHGVRPTPRAAELLAPVREALAILRSSLSQRVEFDPAVSDRVFRVAIRSDLAEAFAVALHTALPQSSAVQLVITPSERSTLARDLRFGEPELAIADVAAAGPDCRSQRLFSDDFVLAARRGHPGITRPLSWSAFAGLGHVVMSRPGLQSASPIDEEFKRRGKRRSIPIALPSASAALSVVLCSDLVATVGRRVATALSEHHPIEIHELPFIETRLSYFMSWHERFDNDHGHRWLRGLMQAVFHD